MTANRIAITTKGLGLSMTQSVSRRVTSQLLLSSFNIDVQEIEAD